MAEPEISKTQLRKRWADLTFLEGLPSVLKRPPLPGELRELDLRGIQKLGDGPTYHFSFHSTQAERIDFSYGDGSLIVFGSEVSHLKFEEFKFDRATRFSKSTFSHCDFKEARLRLDAKDCEFIGCSFDLSTFAGGFSEYGFTRCTFRDCSFRSARWKGTYFKACTLLECDLSRFQVIDSLVTSIKHRGCKEFSTDIFTGGEIRSIEEIA